MAVNELMNGYTLDLLKVSNMILEQFSDMLLANICLAKNKANNLLIEMATLSQQTLIWLISP